MTNAINIDETVADVVELITSGKNRGQVHGYLLMQDYSTKDAKHIAKLAYDKLGLSTNAHSHADHEKTVAYIRNNYGKLPKKQLIEGMCETNGKTYLTNQHAYNYIAMMQEYAKQEVEANS